MPQRILVSFGSLHFYRKRETRVKYELPNFFENLFDSTRRIFFITIVAPNEWNKRDTIAFVATYSTINNRYNKLNI